MTKYDGGFPFFSLFPLSFQSEKNHSMALGRMVDFEHVNLAVNEHYIYVLCMTYLPILYDILHKMYQVSDWK